MKKEYSIRVLDTQYTIAKWITVCEYYEGRNGVMRKTAKYTYDEAKAEIQGRRNEGSTSKYRIYKGANFVEEIA